MIARWLSSVLANRICCHFMAAMAMLLLGNSIAHAQTSRPALAPNGHFESDAIGRPPASSGSGSGHSLLSPGATDNSLDIRRVVLSLAIVLGLVFGIRWMMRWVFPTASVARTSQVMKVLSRSVIAPKQQLLLVQVGRRLVVVGDCGTQMNALAEITDPDEVASLVGQLKIEPSEREPRAMFAPILGRAQEQFDDVPPITDDLLNQETEPAELAGTRSELSGLTEKIRLLSRHLGKAN